MHAYLVIGGEEETRKKIDELIEKQSAIPLRYELSKIADVRNLLEFTKLSQPQKTAIIAESIHLASEEAQNSLLKSLEEPPENLMYILTSPREELVLPTILSRCTTVYVANKEKGSNPSKYENFLELSVGERLQIISKIQKREDAISFLNQLITDIHGLLPNHPKVAPFLEEALETLTRIKANGNVHLQLTNLVTSTDSVLISR